MTSTIKKGVVLLSSVILLAGLIYGVFTNTSIKKTITLATTQIPTSFTELYFENHTKLPTKITKKATDSLTPKQTVYSFAFTITNRENKEMDYTYEIYREEDDTNKTTLIDKGKVFIYNNNSKTIKETYTMPNTYPRTKIVVNLIEKNQQIAFWMKGQEE